MNANQIFNMLFRMFFRKVVNRGMNAGINRMAGGGKSPDQMTPEERQRAKTAREVTKRGQQAMRVARRVSRF